MATIRQLYGNYVAAIWLPLHCIALADDSMREKEVTWYSKLTATLEGWSGDWETSAFDLSTLCLCLEKIGLIRLSQKFQIFLKILIFSEIFKDLLSEIFELLTEWNYSWKCSNSMAEWKLVKKFFCVKIFKQVGRVKSSQKFGRMKMFKQVGQVKTFKKFGFVLTSGLSENVQKIWTIGNAQKGGAGSFYSLALSGEDWCNQETDWIDRN